LTPVRLSTAAYVTRCDVNCVKAGMLARPSAGAATSTSLSSTDFASTGAVVLAVSSYAGFHPSPEGVPRQEALSKLPVRDSNVTRLGIVVP
jgi:hypothetical protein